MKAKHWFIAAVSETLRSIGKWAGQRIVAPIVAFALVVGLFFIGFFTFKHFNPDSLDPIRQSNSVPSGRTDSTGSPIPIGKGDQTGQAQAPVVPIEKPKPFTKPTTVRFTPPKGPPIEVPLPTGVEHGQVGQVVVVTPQTTDVKVRDDSNITEDRVDTALKNPEVDRALYDTLLREKKCQLGQLPQLTLDPITITTDRQGRVFVSGNDPVPYLTHLRWCGYTVEVTGKLDVVAAQPVPETWGLRLRLKAALGYLPVPALTQQDGYAGLDVGLLTEPFFFQSFNLNVYTGVRSLGLGIGYDVTPTVTLYGGYAATFPNFDPSPHVAVGFSLW